jgi:ketosteroid isomerase-like protein
LALNFNISKLRAIVRPTEIPRVEREREPDIPGALDAPDVTLTFPGDNSWSGTFRGKAAVRRWLERMARIGLQTFPTEVVAVGFPWNTTICIRGYDYLRSPEGETVYENRFVI